MNIFLPAVIYRSFLTQVKVKHVSRLLCYPLCEKEEVRFFFSTLCRSEDNKDTYV